MSFQTDAERGGLPGEPARDPGGQLLQGAVPVGARGRKEAQGAEEEEHEGGRQDRGRAKTGANS